MVVYTVLYSSTYIAPKKTEAPHLKFEALPLTALTLTLAIKFTRYVYDV